MTILLIISVLTIILVILLVKMYNTLIEKKNQVTNIFSSVNVLLKKRYNLIPNLVSLVSRYMTHEKEILQKITELRTQFNKPGITDDQKVTLDHEISATLGKIMVAVENYPNLKANENFLHLQHTLTEVEAQISAARRAYNLAVTNYNNAIEMVPTNFMAMIMGYTHKKVFGIKETETQNINIKELFNR